MILCFGIFGRVLKICNQGLSQEKLISKVAWVIDRKNSSLASGLDYIVEDPDVMEGNKPVVSKLLSCTYPLELRDKYLPSVEGARERFKSKVMPLINEDMIAKAVLAVCNIIAHDDTIVNERKETFKKYMGMYREEFLQQTSFDVPDFFARVLLYTTCVNNKEGQPYVAEITDTFLEEAVNAVWAESRWDTTTQTLELIPTEEKRLLDEVETLSELRLSAMEYEYEFTDMGWLGIDETVLFPSRYKHVKIRDPEARRLILNKMVRYIELTHEFMDCLVSAKKSSGGRTEQWPVFPNEQLLDIRRQLTTLHDEIFVQGLFSESLKHGQEQGTLPEDG